MKTLIGLVDPSSIVSAPGRAYILMPHMWGVWSGQMYVVPNSVSCWGGRALFGDVPTQTRMPLLPSPPAHYGPGDIGMQFQHS